MLAAIWAQSRNGVFGVQGGLPWDVPEDLLTFRRLTMGGTLLMGRATWESLPRRPLPGRRNVVLSGQPGLVLEGADVLSSVDEIRGELPEGPAAWWCIGGRQVLDSVLPYVDTAVVTLIDADVEGDVLAPGLDEELELTRRYPDSGWLTSRTGTTYALTQWTRRGVIPLPLDLGGEAAGRGDDASNL